MEVDSESDALEETGGEVEFVVPPTRRSGRPSKKSEKARAPNVKEEKSKGVKGGKEGKDKSSSKYLSFSAGKHSYWVVPVCDRSWSIFPFVDFNFSANLAYRGAGSATDPPCS